MKTRSHVPALVLVGWAACVPASLLHGQPGGGIDLPTPDLQVFVGTHGDVSIHVKAKRPVGLRTAPKTGITPRTEKPSRSEKP